MSPKKPRPAGKRRAPRRAQGPRAPAPPLQPRAAPPSADASREESEDLEFPRPEADELPEATLDADALAEPEIAAAPAGPSQLPAPYDPLTRYIQEIRLFPPLTREEEIQLARRHRDLHDPEATRRLVTAHLMLVVKLALMYRRAIRNVMDLIQEGNIGLLEALKRYDPDMGVRFPTYAAWWVKAYMLKFLLDNARMVRVGTTNARRKLLYNLRRERDKLLQQGIAPTPKLLAERFGVPEADVIDVEEAISGHDVSVDAPITDDGAATMGDILPAREPSVEETVSRKEVLDRVAAAIAEFRKTLNEREQEILDARLVAEEPATLQELGDRFGVTREAVRQTENRLKERLAQFLKGRLGEEVILQFTGRR